MSGLTRKPRVGDIVEAGGREFTVTHFDRNICWTIDRNGNASCFIWWFERTGSFNTAHTIVKEAA